MSSSQDFIPIEDIRNDLVFLKDGTATLVISTSAVNFGLLFETEQIAIIEAFAGLLNSLSFPIQIVISSQRLDVSSYLGTLDKAASLQENPLLKEMTERFRQFVESLIKEKNVLDKQFFVSVAASAIELGLLSKNKTDKDKKALTVLSPRRDHLIRQLGKIGLKSKQLSTAELVKLFHDIYNPMENSPVTLRVASSPRVVPPPLIRYQPPPKTPPAPIPNIVQPTNPIASQLSPPFVVEELADD